METGKRKFSARRLYKLVRLLVIVIAIFSGIVAYINFRAVEYHAKEYDEAEKAKEPIRSDLKKQALLGEELANNNFSKYSVIAIGLPIIFFGGTGLYRYLFPIQKESKGG